MALVSLSLVLLELLLTRLFALVLFAQFAHLALALGLLGISLGAVLHHLAPQLMGDDELERRLGWLALVQAGLTLLAVVCSIEFPLTLQFDEPPVTYQERSGVRDDLLDPVWFGLLLPILTLPFASAGLAFSAVFHRRRQWIGALYGADLAGGALGAVLFIPLLGSLAGPDAVFAIVLAGGLAAFVLGRVVRARRLWIAGSVVSLLSVGALGVAATGDVLEVRYSAGYSEENITFSRWTALTRVSVHEDDTRGAFIVLDNSSASEVFIEPERRAKVARTVANRSVVYQLVEPGARIAILAASAGPEVGVAQHFGHTSIDAIDIAGEISEVVATRFPDAEANPYLQPGVRPVKADGRAAILHASEPYDVIQMVHANLWSSAGLLSSAWSPSLLETREAFETYLDHLTEDGILSFGRGGATDNLARSAAAALLDRGATDPWRHIFYIRADTSLMLVRPRPWTRAERDAAWKVVKQYRNARWVVDPVTQPSKKVREMLLKRPVMTDDRPYLDDWKTLKREFSRALDRASGASDKPIAILYRSVFLQAAFVLLAGLVFIGVPFLRRGPTGIRDLRHLGKALLYVSCLGYGYLAVETVLIHELVLFVGHPTYAVTVTILAMLLASGLGSAWTGRVGPERRLPVLRGVLVTVLVLGAVQALAVPPLLHAVALGWPLAVRVGITFLVLFPLGFVMGMPFPLAMSQLDERAGGMVPWAWALNGWMSVVASLVTVVLSRVAGYSAAFGVALGAYALALVLAGFLQKVGPRS